MPEVVWRELAGGCPRCALDQGLCCKCLLLPGQFTRSSAVSLLFRQWSFGGRNYYSQYSSPSSPHLTPHLVSRSWISWRLPCRGPSTCHNWRLQSLVRSTIEELILLELELTMKSLHRRRAPCRSSLRTWTSKVCFLAHRAVYWTLTVQPSSNRSDHLGLAFRLTLLTTETGGANCRLH